MSIYYLLTRADDISFTVFIGSLAIIIFALIPTFIWSKGWSPGLPILPLHLFALVWTFGIPLASERIGIIGYDSDQYMSAVFTVLLYAVAATVTWLFTASIRIRRSKTILVLESDRGITIMLLALIAGSVFFAMVIGAGIAVDPGVFGIIRSAILALTLVSIFVLAYRLGRRELNIAQGVVFVVATVCYVVMQAATLFLVGAIVGVASLLIGYSVGTRRIPWVTLAVVVAMFSVLHLGKKEMRAQYWGDFRQTVHIGELPAFFSDWIGLGLARLTRSEEPAEPILERLSLIHLLLFAQATTPTRLPFMEGYSYEMIPELIVPRIFHPDKPSSHEGTTRLNVYYGIQPPGASDTTTIGWGLLNEAWANFGNLGVFVLGCVMGALYGWVGRLTNGVPAMSMRMFVGATFAAIALQTEFTMGVYVTVLFQSLVVLSVLVPFLRRHPIGAPA